MTYLIYTRVSPRGSDWQGETSCEAQEAEVRTHLVRTDPSANFVPTLSDEFRTGRNNHRPALQSALREAATGHAKWDALVVLDVDRISRSMEGYVDILKQLEKAGKGLIATRQGLDLASLHGRMVMQIMVSISEYFVKINAAKTVDKMRWMAKERGAYVVGSTPTGYRRVPGNKETGAVSRIEPDPEQVPRLVKLFTCYAVGDGISKIRTWFPMPKQSILRILRSKVYIGQVPFGGEWYPGKHAPIIEKDLWSAVQARLPVDKHSPRPSACAYDYLLTGMVRCSCGLSMSPFTRRRDGHVWPYYRCPDSNCSQKGDFVRADELETAIASQMAGLWRQPAMLKAATEALRSRLMADGSVAAKDLENKIAELRQLEEQNVTIAKNLANEVLGHAAAKIVSETAEVVASRIATLQGEIGALRAGVARENAEKMSLDQVDTQFARMAREVAAGNENRTDLRRLLRAWVLAVQRQADGTWTARYPLGGVSTNCQDWHPRRDSNTRPAD